MKILLEGGKVADHVYASLHGEIAGLSVKPKIVFIRVGEDPASLTYVKSKAKRSLELGLLSETLVFPEKVLEKDIINKIEELNSDGGVHGILVQLPLPAHLNKERVLETIHPLKDVDGLHPDNTGRLSKGQPRFVPCTPAGILEICRFYEIPIPGSKIVIIGRSDIVGKPTGLLMLLHHATVTLCHSRTRDLAREASAADILIVAMGKPRFVGPDFVREGATVIDVGIHRVDGKICGDVDFEKVAPKAGAITPVPGGVGKMTIAMLMKNLVEAARIQS